MTFKNYDGVEKQYCRSIATASVDKPYRHGLFLPGARLACVKEALKNKAIGKNTAVDLVERLRNVSDQIRKVIKRDELQNNVAALALHTEDITRIDLKREAPGSRFDSPVDFAFLDFCGNISPQIVRWLMSSGENWLSPTSKMSFTCFIKPRGRMPWFRRVSKAFGDKLPMTVHNNFIAGDIPWLGNMETASGHMPESSYAKLQFLMLSAALPYKFRLDYSHRYDDSGKQPMVFYCGHMTGERTDDNVRRRMANVIRGTKFGTREKKVPRPVDRMRKNMAAS